MWNLLFLNPYLSYRVKPLPAVLPPPPPGTERFLIGPEGKQIEVLRSVPVVEPSTSATSTQARSRKRVFFLQHGGFGRAECYTHFLRAIGERGGVAYSISVRGHGWSWRPSFLGMVFTTRHRIAVEDVGPVVDWIRAREGEDIELIAVGHSAGGGMIQYATQENILGPVHKMVLIAAFPPFGGSSVYWSWYGRLDPLGFPRALFVHLMHPRSPLSTPALLKGAFFSKEYPMDKVQDLADVIPTAESLMWPFSMMYPFINVSKVLEHIPGGKKDILVVAGGDDKLMRPHIMKKAARVYGASYEEVPHSGHHVMLDLFWQDALERIFKFVGF